MNKFVNVEYGLAIFSLQYLRLTHTQWHLVSFPGPSHLLLLHFDFHCSMAGRGAGVSTCIPFETTLLGAPVWSMLHVDEREDVMKMNCT